MGVNFFSRIPVMPAFFFFAKLHMWEEGLNWDNIIITITKLLHWLSQDNDEIYKIFLADDNKGVCIKVAAPEYLNQALVAVAGIRSIKAAVTNNNTIIIKENKE